MKTIQVNAYEYKELDYGAKHSACYWLNNFTNFKKILHKKCMEFIKDKSKLISPSLEDLVLNYCQTNKYLFDVEGNPIHHLDINRNKKEAA